MVSFFTAGSWEKDTIFGAARKIVGPSYFVMALATSRFRQIFVAFSENLKFKFPRISKSGSLEQLKTINTRVGLCYLYHCLIKCHQFNKKAAQVLSQNLFKTLNFGVLLKLCHLYRNNATKRFKVPRCLTTSGVHLNFSKVFNSQGP